MLKLDRFAEELKSYLASAEKARRSDASHDQRRHLFLRFIERAFGIDPDRFDIELGVGEARFQGRVDTLLGDLVFEFKRDLDAERATGKTELTKYLLTPQVGAHCFGIITDGIVFEVYGLREGKLRSLGDSVDLGKLASENPESALLWLDSFLFQGKSIPPKSNDVVKRFGADSAVFYAAAENLREMFMYLRGDDTTQVKFTEWNSLLAKVYGSRDVGNVELFLRHTYLSLLAKTLAYLALVRRQPQSESNLLGIVSGVVFQRRGIFNLAEEDFFAWVLHDQVREAALKLLRGLAKHLGIYDASRVDEDLLKELYQELIDPETRHDLGEFYTPDWLAMLTLREAGYNGRGSVLDPACGSGTFLFSTIRLAREVRKTDDLVTYAQDNVMGVDVHPLAVTISRVNYALALGPDLKKHQGKLVIPVYMADSLLREERKNGEPIEIPISGRRKTTTSSQDGKKKATRAGQTFIVPACMARNPRLLDDIVDACCQYGRGEGDKDELVSGFVEFLAKRWRSGDDIESKFWRNNVRLMIDLVRKGRDTIWGFILRNAYRPIFLSDRGFDFIVGNPPWLAYRYIQDERYQEQIKNLTFAYGLLGRNETKLFTQMDTSTIFYEFCWDRYRKPGGTVAFVMPRTILTGTKQHDKFRQLGFTSIVTLEGVSPLFGVPACVLIRRAKAIHTSEIPTKELSGTLPARNLTWEAAKSRFTSFETTYSPPESAGESSYLSQVKNGATIFPRCFWFVRPIQNDDGGTTDPNRPFLETDTIIEEFAKVPWKGLRFEGEVEAEFLYATLLTRHLLPFGVRRLDLVVLPIVERSEGLLLLQAEDAMRRGFPFLSDWLSKVEATWAQHKKESRTETACDYLNWQNKLVLQSPTEGSHLVYNAGGTHLAACVVDCNSNIMKQCTLSPRGFVVQHETYHFTSDNLAESHYLCAIVNSPCVNAFIKPFQPQGLWGERRIERRPFEVLPIPKYDPNKTAHQRLAELSQICHRIVEPIAPKMTGGNIGEQRSEVRRILRSQLSEIDELTREILGEAIKGLGPRVKHRETGPRLFTE